jgi:site-specific DNA-methyltransferase (adenine-specific)
MEPKILENSTIYNADCFDVFHLIPDKSIDCIITDPPYGTTACKWDSVIPFDEMWGQLNRIIKPNAAIVLFGSEPFSSALRMSNIKNYKYDWTWNKIKPGAFAVAKYKPLGNTENISVFALNKHNYYPIMESQKPRTGKIYASSDSASVKYNDGLLRNYDEKYPKTLITFSNANNKGKQHPTQKPIELMEYLIKTYTKENETVLDFTMGSGTTGVACVNTGRKFIGIEKEKNYFDIAVKRIKEAGHKLFV